ncbi:hypothetical protein SAMN05428988_0365 [Chitinophaga sp. YR573]|nr:hypothetical protein SAMN05428988_0365 [Chitinophaga sp. YR573]
MLDKFDIVTAIGKNMDIFFADKIYGSDVEVIYIGIRCLTPVFESAFPKKKPKYDLKGKVYHVNNDDGPIKSPDKALSYSLTLDYSKYKEITDIRSIFPQDVLDSLDIIGTIKQIKDFDLVKFKSDFETFFKSVGWI